MALARACYSTDKDIYIFDDLFCAADPDVAQHIYINCLNDLLRNKTRIVFTHDFQYLVNADLVLFIENGKILKSGPGVELIPIIADDFHLKDDKNSNTYSWNLNDSTNDAENQTNSNQNFNVSEQIQAPQPCLITQTSRFQNDSHGEINFDVYKYYGLSSGKTLPISILISLVFMQRKQNINSF